MPRLDPFVRRQIYISERQTKRLNALAKRTGITVSEHIRRSIDIYLSAATRGDVK